MNHEHVTLTFKVYWYFTDYPHLKVTRCKKIINTKNETLLKYGVRGFKIGSKFYKRNEINKMLKPIKSSKFPF